MPAEDGVSDIVAAAVIAALASIVGAVLTFIVGIRQIKRSVSTASGTPLGPALDSRLEHIEFRLARIEDSVVEVRERLAFEEGRSWPRRWPPTAPPHSAPRGGG
jgi:hypothetical protein